MTRKEFIAFVTPSAALMLTLLAAPLAATFYMSLQRLTFGGAPVFVGLDNFVAVLKDAQFHGALAFTLLYVAISIPMHTALGFCLALMLERVAAEFRGALIAAFAMPFIMTPVVGTLVFSWFFKDYWGLVPFLLDKVGLHVLWFADPWPARWVLILWGIWWSFGFNVIVLFAGLQTLPEEVLNAAVVDGAGWFQRLRHIVVPHLLPFFGLITLFNLMDAYRIFDSVWVMTKGGPGTATETLSYLNYRVAFELKDLGRGSAISMLSILGILVLTAPFLWRRFKQDAGQ